MNWSKQGDASDASLLHTIVQTAPSLSNASTVDSKAISLKKYFFLKKMNSHPLNRILQLLNILPRTCKQ
jgi:hypothetical protein